MRVQPSELLTAFRGAIFDIDGTIVDSMDIHLKAWQEIALRYGVEMTIREMSENVSGINDEIIGRIFPGKFSDAEKEKIANEKEELFRNMFDPSRHVIKGFLRFLDVLREEKMPLVVGTAAPIENVDFFLNTLGIKDYFTGIIHEDDVVAGKPNPDVFLKAAGEIDVPIEECIVFEDSTSGAEASAKAGSKTIVVLSTKAKSDFNDIPNIIAFIHDYTELLAV